MLIDTSAYVGHWPFRKLTYNTLDGLDKIAKNAGITHMFVANVHGIFYKDSMQGNLELVEDLKNYNGETKMLPVAIIDPTYPAWREDMTRCVKELGFKCIELCPTYHGIIKAYSLAKEGAEAFKLAGELGVPVRICRNFEDIRQHHRNDVQCHVDANQIPDMLAASEKTALFLNGFYPNYLPQKLVDAINARDNVFVDISRTEYFTCDQWEKTFKLYGAKRVCYGTLSPFYYADTTLVRLHFAPNPAEDLELLRYKNVEKYI